MTAVAAATRTLAAGVVLIALSTVAFAGSAVEGIAGRAYSDTVPHHRPPGTATHRLVVADRQDGRPVAALPLPADGRFALTYRHSAYAAPAAEIFTATGDQFTMRAVASPNEAVLDYYAVAGPRRQLAGWWVLRLDAPRRFDELALIASPVGRRMLGTGRDCVPLFPRSGAHHLKIRIVPGQAAGNHAPPATPCPPQLNQLLIQFDYAPRTL